MRVAFSVALPMNSAAVAATVVVSLNVPQSATRSTTCMLKIAVARLMTLIRMNSVIQMPTIKRPERQL